MLSALCKLPVLNTLCAYSLIGSDFRLVLILIVRKTCVQTLGTRKISLRTFEMENDKSQKILVLGYTNT